MGQTTNNIPPIIPNEPPVISEQRKIQTQKGKGLPLIVKITLFLIILFFGFLGFRVVQMGINSNQKDNAVPGELEFRAANRQIISNKGTTAFGNSTEAVSLAQDYSLALKTFRDGLFTEGKKDGYSISKGEFLTYCQLNEDSCVFLVHVPELRRFTSDAQKSLTELAWASAQIVLKAKNRPSPETIAVGVKGAMLYEAVLIGEMVSGPKQGNGGIKQRDAGFSGLKLLYPFFASGQGEASLSTSNALDRVRRITAAILNTDAAEIDVTKPLVQQGADGLDLVEIVMAVEEEFKTEVPDSAIGDATKLSISSLAEIVEKSVVE